jgi:hypothetical protein
VLTSKIVRVCLVVAFGVAALVFASSFFPCSPTHYPSQHQGHYAGTVAEYTALLSNYLCLWFDVAFQMRDFVGRNIERISTSLIALFTATLWWSTSKLWEASEKQTRIAEESLSVGSRPWVGVERITLSGRPQAGKPLSVDVLVRNCGNSPALELRGGFRGHVFPNNQPPPGLPHVLPLGKSATVVFPGVIHYFFPFANSRVLDQNDVDAIGEGKKLIWVAGRLDYADARRRPHFTTILVQYSPGVGFGSYLTGNDAT